jgi:zinc-binding alcohol dehydrogenase family protein
MVNRIVNSIKDLFTGGEKMQAVGYNQNGKMVDAKVIKPKPKRRELLVRIDAVSVNPVDSKMFKAAGGNQNLKILGFDAVGIVESVGDQVQKFKIGDKVFYAGTQKNQGSDAEFQIVDEQLVGMAPKKLSNAQIAAMPLTSITSYEILVDQLELDFKSGAGNEKTILIINGSGGVGSTLIQLSKYLGLKVIATAGRPESTDYVKKLGADIVINREANLVEELKKNGYANVDYIAMLYDINAYWESVVQILKPFGTVVSIEENKEPFNIDPLKNKGQQFKWEFMFAKGNYEHEMQTQGDALNMISKLLEAGTLQSTLSQTFQGINAANILESYDLLDSGKTLGKIVLTADFK